MTELVNKNGQFYCKICKGYHKYETSIHIPIPKVVDDIRRGDEKVDFQILSKNLFLINKEFLLALGIIEIPIIDDPYGDYFEQYIWVEISKDEFKSKFMEINEEDKQLEFKAKIDRLLPYYGNNNNKVPVTLRINLSDTIPLEILDIKTNNLVIKKHMKTGILTEELIEILKSIIHN